MMDRLRVGFVGTGFMGQLAHLAHYVQLGELCKVTAVAEPRTGLAEKVAFRYGIDSVYSDHRKLLSEADVDCIVAAQPYRRHVKIIPDILSVGIPVFTEKPLAVSVKGGRDLVECAEQYGVLHMVGYHKRSDPAMEYARDRIREWRESGEYGEMRMVRITMPPGDWVAGADRRLLVTEEEYPEGEAETPPAEFDEETFRDYNSFINYYIHQVNALRFLLDEPYEVVFGDSSGVLMVVESESGICGTVEMAPYQTSTGWEESILVGFERAALQVELPAPLVTQRAGRVSMRCDDGDGHLEQSEPAFPPVSAMHNQAKNFLKAVRGESPAPCDSKEALEDLHAARQYIEMVRSI